MPRYIGCDIHKREAQFAFLAEDGAWEREVRLPCTREALAAFAQQHFRPGDCLALEATFHTWAVVEVLAPFVDELIVSNPLRTKAIAAAKIKTDRVAAAGLGLQGPPVRSSVKRVARPSRAGSRANQVDARVLAQLLRADFLPRVWRPDPETQRRRRLVSRRASLVADRTTIKNRIHAVLHHRLIPAGTAELFNRPGLAWLQSLRLDDDGRAALDSELRLLAACEAEIRRADDQLAALAYADPRLKLLMTLPGVDFGVAGTVLAALGDIARFRDGAHAASYLGLVPSTRQSGDHCYHGPITRHGNPHARWLLVQAAQHLATHPGPLGVFFRRLLKKKNRNVAVVACARKLVVIAWHMLAHNEPYRYAQPRAVEAKLSRLRVRVTRQPRRGGVPKGTPRSPHYGHGRTRRVPSLAEAYAAEGVPAPLPLSAGENKMLRDHNLVPFHQRLEKSYRVPKPGPANSLPNSHLGSTEKTS